ncbi:MAG TPA: ABC transporter ATP-binding protein [Gammaproteobacteria bacterium]|nr:ABC transporter ATP-binding protein [Gammaproteobacteria bacterium]
MNAETAPLLEVRGLQRRFGRQQAVRGLDFDLRRGEVLALLGPNGAGKTSTLSLLSGNLAPHAGSIRIAGHDLLARPRAAKRALGYLPEHPPLYPELTVAEYLGYCARLHGVGGRAATAAAKSAGERCGLASVAQRLIGQLSKGYRQRVGLAQAIVHRPQLLLLDEPTVGLDPMQLAEVRRLIRDLCADAALIVSTHLLSEAAEVASRVMILHHGRVAYDEQAAKAETQPRFRVELARAPETGRLERIDGIARVELLGAGNFVVTAEPAVDPRESLLRSAVEENWGLLSLTAYRPSLEETFVRLTLTSPETAN